MHNTYDYDAYDAYDDVGGIPQDPGRGLDHKSGTFKPQGDPVQKGRGRIDTEKLNGAPLTHRRPWKKYSTTIKFRISGPLTELGSATK